MITKKYLNFNDIKISFIPNNNYSEPISSYNNHSYYLSNLEDFLWTEFQYDKYGEDYENGKIWDELTESIDKEFQEWIKRNHYIVYEWFECTKKYDSVKN